MTSKLNNEQLAQNAKIINEQHNAILNAEKGSFERAVTAGRTLKACKGTVGHGDWLDWLAQNCPSISERTAQDYMWAAAKEKEVEKRLVEKGNPQRAADLSIRYAKSLLAKAPLSAEERAKKKAERAQAIEQEVTQKANELAASMSIKPTLSNLAPDELFNAIVNEAKWEVEKIVDFTNRLNKHLAQQKQKAA